MAKRLALMVCALLLGLSPAFAQTSYNATGTVSFAPGPTGTLSRTEALTLTPAGVVTPPPPPPPSGVPPQASAVGYTTQVFNQDFTQMALGPLSMGCFSGGRGGGGAFPWYQGLWYEYNFGPACPGSYQIVNDGATKALDLRYTIGQPSGGYGQTTVMSIAPDGTHPTSFTHGYFEWITRMSPFTSGGQWMDDWMWTAEDIVAGTACSGPTGTARCDEIDVTEQHSEVPNLYIAADHQWTDNAGHGPNLITNKNIDYTQYHKFGLLWTPGQNCFYVDDVQTFCGATTEAGEIPRFLMMSQGIGCAYSAGYTACVNAPVTGATNNGSGLVRLKVSTDPYTWAAGDRVVVSGVGGVSGANGTFTIANLVGYGTGITAVDLAGSTFSGAYTSGGTINPVTSTDLFAKSVRVWQGTYAPGVIWNSADNSNLTLNGTSACSQTTVNFGQGVRATNPETSGKRHIEYTLTATLGSGDWIAGIADSSEVLTDPNLPVGKTAHSIGIWPNTVSTNMGVRQNNVTINTYPIAWQVGDVIAMEVDIPNHLVWWQDVTKGTGWTNASNSTLTGNPASGTGGTSFTATGGIMPMFAGYYQGSTPICTVENPLVFHGTVSSGFTAWGS